MDKLKEKELYVEMLSDLIKQRRVITEEIILVRNKLDELDSDIKRTQEYMSATEYINIRNAIRKELELEMRQQVKTEIVEENAVELNPDTKESIIPKDVVQRAKEVENKNNTLSFEALRSAVENYLRDEGIPRNNEQIRQHCETLFNTNFSGKAWTNTMWRIKTESKYLESTGRGFTQYKR